MLNPGTKLGLYEIVSGIGAGGMGEVYQAHDTKLGRDVLIFGGGRLVMPVVLSRAFGRINAVKFWGQS